MILYRPTVVGDPSSSNMSLDIIFVQYPKLFKLSTLTHINNMN